jgi:hypothetical protein
MGSPFISISIVSHGQMHLARKLLRSLSEVHQGDCRFQIVLIENLRSDAVEVEAYDELSVVKLVNSRPCGLAENQNRAFQHAQGDYFCILNPDVTLLEPIFESLVQHIVEGRGDIVAPLVIDRNRTALDSFRDVPTPGELLKRRLSRQSKLLAPGKLKNFVHPDWIAGTFLLMRSDVFRSLGGMDERYYLYFEDVDFCSRARLAGKRLLVDTTLKILHEPRRASQRNLIYMVRHLKSAWRFFTSPVYDEVRRL